MCVCVCVCVCVRACVCVCVRAAGKLQGFRGSSVVAPGSDDGSLFLTLPAQTVNRGDHGNSRAQFSCAVDWIQDKTSDLWPVS